MIREARNAARSWLLAAMTGVAAAFFLAAAGAGCEGKVGAAGGGDGGTTGGALCTLQPAAACTGSEIQASKRLVRLTFNQYVNSVRALLNTTIADQLANNPGYAIVDSTHRSFPPLSSTREGVNITDNVWDTADRMAQ